jgi:hypothetical protein
MTAFNTISRGKYSKRGNIKDGGHFNRQLGQNKDFAANGFIRTDWNKWSYTWPGEFPVFSLAPGIVGTSAGLVASYPQAEIEIIFPYGTDPSDIKARLDSKILEIMRYDAEIAEAELDWDEWEREGLAYDVDDFMDGQWVRS